MDRLACVDLPALPLQILLQEHPEWSMLPAAVVSQDSPQGVLLWVNPHARRQRILPGQRYAAALSIHAGLRAGVVDGGAIDESITRLVGLLHDFSPEVEPCGEMPGVFWLDASGLGRLQPSLKRWADSIRLDLHRLHLEANVAVGFRRFATYALAKDVHGSIVLDDRDAEMAAARRVAIDKLDFDPGVRETLVRLGATTLGDFLDLPAAGIRQRFGPQAHALHRLAAGQTWAPLAPQAPAEPVEERFFFDEPVRDVSALLFVLKQLLETMLARLAAGARALAQLIVLLKEDLPGRSPVHTTDAVADERAAYGAKSGRRWETGWRCERLQPASPTLDAALIVDLVRLRLQSVNLRYGVIEVRLRAIDAAATGDQLHMFVNPPRRDLEAGARALARIRAELGENAVVKAVLREGHLPEARFHWTRLETLSVASPRNVRIRPLVRRLLAKPEPLPPQSKNVRNDGWMLCGLEQGSVTGVAGPYIVSGGWWISPIHREYHYIETERGDQLWVYYDGRRRRWFLHGRVE